MGVWHDIILWGQPGLTVSSQSRGQTRRANFHTILIRWRIRYCMNNIEHAFYTCLFLPYRELIHIYYVLSKHISEAHYMLFWIISQYQSDISRFVINLTENTHVVQKFSDFSDLLFNMFVIKSYRVSFKVHRRKMFSITFMCQLRFDNPIRLHE